MHATIDLPQAFSVRDEHEFLPVQHLLSRMNPKLLVKEVATGVHVDGGSTVRWGLVYYQKQLAQEAVAGLPGIIGIVNQAEVINRAFAVPALT